MVTSPCGPKWAKKAPPSPTKLPWATPEAFHRYLKKLHSYHPAPKINLSERSQLSCFNFEDPQDPLGLLLLEDFTSWHHEGCWGQASFALTPLLQCYTSHKNTCVTQTAFENNHLSLPDKGKSMEWGLGMENFVKQTNSSPKFCSSSVYPPKGPQHLERLYVLVHNNVWSQ
ncbi:uncharacterized protein PGTG_13839 [Puccinia graminis f. sp. tritici CRL 75-36-700-3]|uniref:Uncharacterized protein n=1 Tax=Puccinia graminis f. sp. tritici (strain CRL 75-36-700-3 / race SCCL) TaxID=418459 RepID=E3KUE2_PUCGT|nr:uncharacterized protein PGTG_13839 [Puccinia graminis f. sp. tritici CRL 75-36-700-3]EFP88035.1 hypothetical protein PGTG_13839 [Puccinia graminis f. sp. tritici CRL 75-36-700-3]